MAAIMNISAAAKVVKAPKVQLRARPTAALKARPVVVAKARFGVFAAAVRIPPRSELPRARVAGPVRSRNNRNRPSRSRKFHS